MSELPNFSTMSKDEMGDWFLTIAEQPTGPMTQVDALEEYRERHTGSAA
jgi:hypothetical protein